jgi:hypothetical protein
MFESVGFAWSVYGTGILKEEKKNQTRKSGLVLWSVWIG